MGPEVWGDDAARCPETGGNQCPGEAGVAAAVEAQDDGARGSGGVDIEGDALRGTFDGALLVEEGLPSWARCWRHPWIVIRTRTLIQGRLWRLEPNSRRFDLSFNVVICCQWRIMEL